MENYEEKYKQALERARIEYKNEQSKGNIWVCEKLSTIFPELKESEDKKIRKELISFFTKRDEFSKSEPFDGLSNKQIIAWLEKQGEQKDTVTPQWMIDFLKDNCRHFGTPMDYDEKKETDGKLLAVIKWLEGNPQIEQKPAWSEEDEKILKRIDCLLYSQCAIHGSEYEELHKWLKSLKPQNKWKPSEEQMSMLLAVLNDPNNITSESVYIALKLLYNDLKKL